MMENTDEKGWRVFCAVELPDAARQVISDYIKRLQAADTTRLWRFVETKKLHITLKFIAGLAPQHVEGLLAATNETAINAASFELKIEGTGTFPTRAVAPRVLWLGIADAHDANTSQASSELMQLYRDLEASCERVGFRRETRPLNPHLTLARARTTRYGARPSAADEVAELHRQATFPAVSFAVNEVAVIRSQLRPIGSQYTVLARYRLGGD